MREYECAGAVFLTDHVHFYFIADLKVLIVAELCVRNHAQRLVTYVYKYFTDSLVVLYELNYLTNNYLINFERVKGFFILSFLLFAGCLA